MCYSLSVHGRPDDRWTEFIGLCDHGIVRNDDPLAVKAHPIFAVLRIPINILNAEPIRERTAQAVSTSKMIEPCMQRCVGVAAIVACLNRDKSAKKKDQRNERRLRFLRTWPGQTERIISMRANPSRLGKVVVGACL